jgi:membrane-associated phospholipid phosphatase
MTDRAPLLAWPGWAHLRYAAALSAANALGFVLVYGGCDRLTAHRALRVPVHLPAELRIPFVPAMTPVYLSIYLLFLAAPFVLRTRREFRAAVGALAVIILCGGVGFLLVPAQLAFPPPREAELGIWAGLFHFADDLNLTYNLIPSLHVALSVACVAIFAPLAPPAGRVLLWTWTALIAASAVLLHQHHLLDVATGWLLGVAGARFVYARPAGGPRALAPFGPEDGRLAGCEGRAGTKAAARREPTEPAIHPDTACLRPGSHAKVDGRRQAPPLQPG